MPLPVGVRCALRRGALVRISCRRSSRAEFPLVDTGALTRDHRDIPRWWQNPPRARAAPTRGLRIGVLESLASMMQRWSARSLAPLVRELSRWSAAPVAVAQGGFLHRATVSALERHWSTFAKPTGTLRASSPTSRAPNRRSRIKSNTSVASLTPSRCPSHADDKGDVIDVFPREGSGKIASKHLRRRGMVPGILFGPGDHAGELLSFASADIERLVRKHGHAGVGSRVLELHFEGGDRREAVIAKQLTLDAMTRDVENATFMPCGPDTKVRVRVPIRTEGEDASPGVKRGGFAWKLAKTLEVRCVGKDIPPEIVVDVSKLDIGGKVFLPDIELPEGVQVRLKDERIPIVKIAGKGR